MLSPPFISPRSPSAPPSPISTLSPYPTEKIGPPKDNSQTKQNKVQ